MIDNSELLEHWTELFIGYLNGTLSESEAAEFEELTRDPHFEALREQLTTSGYIAGRMAEYDGFDARRAFGRFRTAAGLGKPAGTLHRWAVAATGIAAAVVVAAGIAFLTRPAPSERERTLQLADAIYPAPDKVTLTLADGRRLQLDGQAERQIDGVGRVSYGTDGVKYEAAPEIAEKAGEAPLYNELSVPDGSKCLVTLEDGTRVWLNARSTLRYPVKFAAGERRVELSGEGLFDVTHDPEHPFVVEAGKATMTVRGTKFNVRDFDDEGMASTTLLEGCVEVGNRSGKVTLEPGMQSRTRGAAEALEIVAHGDRRSSKVVGRRIGSISLPEGCAIGALIRGNDENALVLMGDKDTVIEAEDHVIVFVPSKKLIPKIERLFTVNVGFF